MNTNEIINKVVSTTGTIVTKEDISIILYLALKTEFNAVVESLEHIQHQLKDHPDLCSYVDFDDKDRLLTSIKKTVDQTIKYMNKKGVV